MAKEKKTIAIIVYPGFSLLELIGFQSFIKGLEMGPYKTVVISETKGKLESDTPLPIMIDTTFYEIPEPHGLFVMGGYGVNTIKALASDKLLEYVRKASESAELIGSVGSGALVLAAAGLLNGKQATTHWAYGKVLERLGARYVEKRYVEDGKFFTAAGGSGAMDLALYLLDKLAGNKRAKVVQLFAEYDPQPPFGGIDWAKVNRDGLEPILRENETELRKLFEDKPNLLEAILGKTPVAT